MATGIIALSYGKRAVEPSPLNERLAHATNAANDELRSVRESTMVIAQWEVARALEALGTPPYDTVEPDDATGITRGGTPYLDSRDVVDEALETFLDTGYIDKVLIIANPFLHLQAVRAMVKRAGFSVVTHRMLWIGFDNSPLQLQWWCRGPIRFIAYLALLVVGKIVGKDLHGLGEKSP